MLLLLLLLLLQLLLLRVQQQQHTAGRSGEISNAAFFGPAVNDDNGSKAILKVFTAAIPAAAP